MFCFDRVRLLETTSSNYVPPSATIVPDHPKGSSAGDPIYPITLAVRFTPTKNIYYSSRFRFSCEYGNTFDLVLEGEGTFEEHMHKPIPPVPR